MNYLDFDLEISDGTGRDSVAALWSPLAGEVRSPCAFHTMSWRWRTGC